MRKWSIIPRRTEYGQRLTTMRAAFASTWARLYRQVFWLSDGHRTVEHISVLLHKPSDRIEEVTYELLVSGHVNVQAGEKELGMDPVVLKESFNLVAPYKEAFARHFYSQLFAHYPQTRQLFPATEGGMRRQERGLLIKLRRILRPGVAMLRQVILPGQTRPHRLPYIRPAVSTPAPARWGWTCRS